MSTSFHEKAEQVVARFKDHLGNSQSSVSSNDYDTLCNLIAAAIADELNTTADEIDVIVSRIRNATDKPDLGL